MGKNKSDDESGRSLPSLEANNADGLATAIRGWVGLLPGVGSLLVEILVDRIPNQRMDRVAKYAQELEKRLAEHDLSLVKAKLTNENFTDLIEESTRQAARSLSDERRKYLASVIVKGLTAEDIEFFEGKHLLRILGEINDVEVIILRFYLNHDWAFKEKHKEIFDAHTSPQTKVEVKRALLDNYKVHLAKLGLLEEEYEMVLDTDPSAFPGAKQPKYDEYTGRQEVHDYRITDLGRLLLRQIGLADDEGQPVE